MLHATPLVTRILWVNVNVFALGTDVTVEINPARPGTCAGPEPADTASAKPAIAVAGLIKTDIPTAQPWPVAVTTPVATSKAFEVPVVLAVVAVTISVPECTWRLPQTLAKMFEAMLWHS